MKQHRQKLLWLLFGLLLGLLSTGLILLLSGQDRGTPISLSPPPTLTPTSAPGPTSTVRPIMVQVDGEIENPGVYALQKDARASDLLSLAGNLTQNADVSRVNTALLLEDGDYYYVPAVDEKIPDIACNAPANTYLDGESGFDYPLDLNTASQEALESLPGIGPSKAGDILAYRDMIGRFTTLEDLLDVPGIGEATLDSLKEFLIIQP